MSGKLGSEWVDVALSTLLRQAVRAADKRCYENSLEALYAARERDLVPDGTVYVEGWVRLATLPLIPTHAWLELPDGRLIETTPRYLDDIHQRWYYPVRTYSLDECLDQITAEGVDEFTFPFTEEFRIDAIPKDMLDLYYEIHEQSWGKPATDMLRECHATWRVPHG